MKRIISFFLIIAMLASMVVLPVYAEATLKVFVDPVHGVDTADGSEAAPVKTLAAAYKLLEKGGGTVVLLDTINFTAVTTLPACDYPVTITSKTGAEGIASNSHIIVGGDTTFENISLTLTKNSTGTTICGNGYKLVMGEGVTTVPFVNSTDSYYFCLEGGNPNNAVNSTDVTVMSGHYRYLYAGGYTKAVKGDVKLTMTGGSAANLATCRTGNVSGNVEMNFSGTARVVGTIYAGAATSGDIGGNVTITLGQGAVFKNFYSASNGSGTIAGTTTVICDGFDSTFSYFRGKGGTSCTGTYGGSRLVLKSGMLTKAPTDFGVMDIEIPRDKVFTLACDLTADTLSGSGTMNFYGAVGLTVAAVNGTVNCTADGAYLQNHTYITAPAGSGIVFPEDSGVKEHDGQWYNQDLEGFQGLVLQSNSANKVILYTGLWRSGDTDENTEVTPYITETVDGITYYYYPNLQGNYYVRGTRSGYIGVYQNIYMSPEEAATKTVETVTLEKKGTGGFVPSNVYINTSEVMENEEAWKSEASMFPKYEQYITTPTFDEDRDGHRMTTSEELDAELSELDKEDDDMYLYSLGQSAKYKLNIPLVIFTQNDLSAATTMEQAAAILKKDSEKLTVYYRAHMHGNEPAGGEGALAMIYYLQDTFGAQILDKINLIVVPRLNPDGAYSYLRRLANDTDPNRDQLQLTTHEMQIFQESYLLFDPEVVMDGHERMWNNPWGDMQISATFTNMHSMEWQKTALALDNAAFAELDANGLNGYYYAGVVNDFDPTMGGTYYSMSGSMYILQESRGIHESDEGMERRVAGQMAAATGILNYLHENAADVKSMVLAERESIRQKGETYEDADQFVLETKRRTSTEADREAWGYLNTVGQTINWATGKVTYPTRYPSVDDVAVRTRTAPTAYVLPADLNNIEQIVSLLTMHGFSYTFLPAGATLPLQRYGGDTTAATLEAETDVRFGSGCYVFTMNTSKGLLLSALLEPDHTNSASKVPGNLAQRELLVTSDTYRYIRDLNAQGGVDYTITDASYVNITVWLDGTNGDDTADGLTEATAVKTLEQAYRIMDAALEGADAASQANLKIVGLYELGTTRVYLPTVNFHVTISGKTAADGFSYTGGSTQETRIIDICGDTTFQNMTLHSNSAGNYNHLNANGHKFVIGEGVNCTTKKSNAYFTLAGGNYSGSCASTDLTVRSGKWRTIYVGGYLGAVTGQAKGDISGCWVYQNITVSYRGSIGSVDMKIANTTVSSAVETSAIYAGPIEKKSASQAIVAGDVTITLGENIIAQGVYASGRQGIVNGTVTIIADGIDLSKVSVRAYCADATGNTAAAILKLNTDVTQDVTLDAALPLDLNGYDITGNVIVDGELTVKDSATDDYTVADGACGEITGTVTGTLVAADGYVAAANGFHKFAQYISNVSIRPSNAGIYYSATFLCDEVLSAEFAARGVAVSLVDLPDADFETDADTLYSVGNHGVMVQDILKGDAEDADRAVMDIYAASYVKLKDGTVLTSTENIAYSFYDILMLLKAQNQSAYESLIQLWQ
ncbi:MAG: hypothetical protein IKU07_05035 [Oscillospiraceae bacterium]|nr:hypothetical protein [Oscillospiraceae bacterium]